MATPSPKPDRSLGRELLAGAHALILAAGRGRRMGAPKAMMIVGGKPWWRHQAGALQVAGIESTWVVSETVRAALASEVDAPRRLLVAESDAPMIMSILAGMRTLAEDPPEGVFILPVDVPAPLPATWLALARTARVAIPEHAGHRGHPVYLPWDWVQRRLGPAMQGRGEASALRLDTLIMPDAAVVGVDDPHVTINLNSPEDVARFAESRGDSM